MTDNFYHQELCLTIDDETMYVVKKEATENAFAQIVIIEREKQNTYFPAEKTAERDLSNFTL